MQHACEARSEDVVRSLLRDESLAATSSRCLLTSSPMPLRASFSSGDPDGRIYAMEQLDVLVDPQLKALLFPLLEDLQLSQRLRSLEGLCPQQSLTPIERLCNIINCEFARADRWIRACALQALPLVDRDQVYDEQVAHLFNIDLLLR